MPDERRCLNQFKIYLTSVIFFSSLSLQHLLGTRKEKKRKKTHMDRQMAPHTLTIQKAKHSPFRSRCLQLITSSLRSH